MKRLFLLISLNIFLILSVIAQTVDYNFNASTAVNNVEIDGIDGYVAEDNADNHKYKYAWYLFDGSYFSLPAPGIDLMNSSGTNQNVFKHVLNSTNVTNVSGAWANCEFIGIYKEDDDDPVLRSGGSSIGTTGAIHPPGNSLTDFYNSSILDPINLFYPIPLIAPRKGDTVTYILLYKDTCGSSSDLGLNGEIELTIDNNAIEIINVINPFSGFIPSNNQFKLDIDGLTNGGHRTAFVRLLFKGSYKLDTTTISVDMTLTDPTNDNSVCSSSFDLSLDLKEKNDPHDPNYITSSTKWICPRNTIDSIDYDLHFQNIGAGECDAVKIEMKIPSCFKSQGPHTIKMIRPWNLTNSLTTSPETKVLWELNAQNQLLKTDRPGINKLSGVTINPPSIIAHTKDKITFRLYFKDNYKFDPCSQIPIEAKVTFEELDPIWTAPYNLQVRCDDCSICQTPKGKPKKLSSVKMSSTGGVLDYSHLGNQNSTYAWHPKEGLSNPNIPNPHFSGNQDQIYQLTVVKDCKKSIYQIPLERSSDSKGNLTCCCWWIIGLLGFIALLLIIILVRMPSNKKE